KVCFADATPPPPPPHPLSPPPPPPRYSSHDFVGNPNVLTWLLGRPPTTFETYVRSQYDAFLRKADQ
ncbi:MAG: hypothetical protein ACR2MP_22345, partial [Streptosporangiaceae bacterium]